MSFFRRRLGMPLKNFFSSRSRSGACAEHAFAPRLDCKNVLTVCENNPSKGRPAFVLHRIADHREGFLTAFVVGNDIVGAFVISLVDLFFGHELIDVDRPCALEFDRVEFLRLNLNIAAAFEFITAALVVPFDHATRLFIDHLLAKTISGLAIDLVKSRLLRLT